MPPLTRTGISLGRRQCGQERQRPNAPRPSNLRQQHDRKPAQAARLDEVAVAGPGRIAVDPTCRDLGAPASFQRVVQADDDGPARNEGADQQAEQASRDTAARPTAAIDQHKWAEVRCHCQNKSASSWMGSQVRGWSVRPPPQAGWREHIAKARKLSGPITSGCLRPFASVADRRPGSPAAGLVRSPRPCAELVVFRAGLHAT